MPEPFVVAQRTASLVTLKIACRDDYAAIELYDSIIKASQRGTLLLEIEGAAVKQVAGSAHD